MWEIESPPYAVVGEAELSMLSSSLRGDQRALSTMLSPDFAEIGRSGRRWTYSDIVPMLLEEEPRATPATSEWQFNRVTRTTTDTGRRSGVVVLLVDVFIGRDASRMTLIVSAAESRDFASATSAGEYSTSRGRLRSG